jgi:hypothetical protein
VRRFVFLWALLGAVQWAATTAIDAAAFRRLDWTYEAFCVALLVPAAQAAALAAVAPFGRAISLRRAWRSVASPWTVRVLLAADAAGIVAAFLSPAGRRAAAGMAGLQSAAAGLLMLARAVRGGSAKPRGWLFLAGAAALGAAVFATPVPKRLAGAVFPHFPRSAAVLLVGTAGLAAGTAALLAASRSLEALSPAAGRVLETAAAPALAAVTIVALHLFRFPVVAPPWDAVVLALLLAASGIAVAGAYPSRPAVSGAPA